MVASEHLLCLESQPLLLPAIVRNSSLCLCLRKWGSKDWLLLLLLSLPWFLLRLLPFSLAILRLLPLLLAPSRLQSLLLFLLPHLHLLLPLSEGRLPLSTTLHPKSLPHLLVALHLLLSLLLHLLSLVALLERPAALQRLLQHLLRLPDLPDSLDLLQSPLVRAHAFAKLQASGGKSSRLHSPHRTILRTRTSLRTLRTRLQPLTSTRTRLCVR